MSADQKIVEIRRYGKKARGRSEMIAFLQGRRLTASQAVRAYCYECMGYYADEIEDCQCSTCPLHPFMPYAQKKVSIRTHRPLSALNNILDDGSHGGSDDRSLVGAYEGGRS